MQFETEKTHIAKEIKKIFNKEIGVKMGADPISPFPLMRYNKIVSSSFDDTFHINQSGIYAIEVIASAKSWWQNIIGRRLLLQKDSLTILLDKRSLPSTQKRKLFADDPWNGNILKGSELTVHVFSYLESGEHSLSFVVHGKPFLTSVRIAVLNDHKFKLEQQISKERDRIPWLIFFIDQPLFLATLSIAASASKQMRKDDDDLGVSINGRVMQNEDKKAHRDWHWCGKILKGSTKTFSRKFTVSDAPSRIDVRADGSPRIDELSFIFQAVDQSPRKPRLYVPGSRGEDYNIYDDIISEITKYWNNEFLINKQPLPEPLDPSLVKAIAYQESRLGYGANAVNYPAYPDIMQVGDVRNPAIHVLRSEKGFEEYEWNDKYGKSTVMKFDQSVEIKEPKDSLYWGVRWLFHKAQYAQNNRRNWKTWDEAVEAYHKKRDTKYRDAVKKVYRNGIDKKGRKLLLPLLITSILTSGVLGVYSMSFANRANDNNSQAIMATLKNDTFIIDQKTIRIIDGFHSFYSALTPDKRNMINPYDSYDGPYYVRYERGVFGDLNKDGVKDAVVVLGVNYGGTGQYVHLAAMLFRADGTYWHGGDYAFEDRDVVQHLSIRNGVIAVESIVHGDDDPLCCPSVHTTKKLTLSDFWINGVSPHYPLISDVRICFYQSRGKNGG